MCLFSAEEKIRFITDSNNKLQYKNKEFKSQSKKYYETTFLIVMKLTKKFSIKKETLLF
jgi:hypothetical protein